MDLMQILTNAGVAEEVRAVAVESIKKELHKEFVKKEQYNKKVAKLDEMQTTIDDLNAKMENSSKEDYKAKYEEVNGKLEKYEKERVNSTKINKIKEELKQNGYAKDNIVNLMLKSIDLEKVSVKEDGKLEGFDISTIDKDYSEFKVENKKVGNPPATPPAGTGQGATEPHSLKEALALQFNK